MAKILHDTFTEASDTLLSAHTPDVGTGGWELADWSVQTITVKGGAGYANGSSATATATYVNTQEIDEDVIDISLSATMIWTTNLVSAVWFRLNGKASNRSGYVCIFANGKLYFEKWASGSGTAVGAEADVTWNNTTTKTLRIVQNGTSLKAYIDDDEVLSVTDSGTPYTNAGYVGVASRTDSRLQEFWVDEVVVTDTIAVTEPLKNNTGTVLANQSGIKVSVLKAADLESVYEATATTNASGILSDITNAAIVAGSYHVAIKLTDGSVGITGAIEAV